MLVITRVTNVSFSGPRGMTRTFLTDTLNLAGTKETTFSWTPSADQNNDIFLVCFMAFDDDK